MGNVVKYRNSIQVKVLLLFLVSIFLSGCLSVKPTTTKSGKNYYETFYVGADGNQYFIKPLSFKNSETKEELIVDITFRYKDEIKDSAIVNFTITSPVIYKSLDSLKISNNSIDISNHNTSLLFNEKSNSEFISRFTSEIALYDIKKLFNKDDWTFIIYNATETTKFKPNRKTVKAITALRENVFILM